MCLALLFAAPLAGMGQDGTDRPAPPGSEGLAEKSAAEWRAEMRDYFPDKIKESRDKIRALRIVTKPNTEVTEFPENSAFLIAVTSFYDFIEGKELDIYEEQKGIPGFFPTREAYYDFLDTVLPAMRERRFERNRLLSYTVHSIEPAEDEPGDFIVQISIKSDDIFPFGKFMLFEQRWHNSSWGYYPGKVSAEDATYWEKVR